MKKTIALILVFALMLCTAACSGAKNKDAHNGSTSTEPQETTVPQNSISPTQTIEEDERNLTASVIIDRINANLAKNNLGSVSNIETKAGTEEGQVVTSFGCVNGLVRVSVTETNGMVDYILSVCLPSQVNQVVPSDSLAEAAIGAYTFAMVPLSSCEPQIDNSWHQERFLNAPEEGDASMSIRTYTSKEWQYTAMVGEATVTCLAAKYCSQCKNNAPKVHFSSGSQVCDSCSNNSVSNSSNATQPPAMQLPTECSHIYADATCTKPQTCTKCGATAGSAAGHIWKSATCTHPETCSVCNHTQGDALGHNIGLTKCSRCDYEDYSAIAKSYAKVTACDAGTGEDLEVTNVSVSNAGILSFTFNGKTYSITIKERVYDSMTEFDCYQSGSQLPNANCRIGDASYYNMLHFAWVGIDGHHLYFYTEKQ